MSLCWGLLKGVSHRGQSSRELKKINVYDLPEPFPDLKKKKKKKERKRNPKYDNTQIMLESGDGTFN